MRSWPVRILWLFLLATCSHPPSLARLVHPVWPAFSPLCAAPLPVPHSAVWRVSPWGDLGRLLRGVPCAVRWAPDGGPSRRPVFFLWAVIISCWVDWCVSFAAGLRGPALPCDPEGGHSSAAATLAWRMRAACFLVCSSGPLPFPPALEPRALCACALPPCVCACLKAPSSALPSPLLQEWEQRLPGLQSTTQSWWTRSFCNYLI